MRERSIKLFRLMIRAFKMSNSQIIFILMFSLLNKYFFTLSWCAWSNWNYFTPHFRWLYVSHSTSKTQNCVCGVRRLSLHYLSYLYSKLRPLESRGRNEIMLEKYFYMSLIFIYIYFRVSFSLVNWSARLYKFKTFTLNLYSLSYEVFCPMLNYCPTCRWGNWRFLKDTSYFVKEKK